MRFTTKWTGGAVAITLALAGAARADFTFSKVVDSSSTYATLGAPVLNNSNQVAYQATLSAGGQGIYRTAFGPGGTTTATIATGTEFAGFSMNNAGAVAYVMRSPNWGVYTSSGNGGPTTTVMTIADYPVFASIDTAVINDSGTVAFRVWNSHFAGNGWGIYKGDGSGQLVGVTPAGGYPYVTAPDINNAGVVAYAWRTTLGATTLTTTNGDVLTPATQLSDGIGTGNVTNIGGIDINGNGDLAFDGAFGYGRSLFARVNGVFTHVAYDVGGGINDNDLLAAVVTNGSTKSLRIGTGPLSTTVISTGDALDGSTVTAIGFNRDGLNDADQIAFLATLADGRQGIYVVSVPEPTTAAGLALIACATLLRRRPQTAKASLPHR
jgi:hypothetical protein